jgi:prolyl-tRNA synthetase
VKEAAERLHAELAAAGFDVLLDDRDERPGVMFADSELAGIPQRIVVGERGLKQDQVEYQGRREAAARSCALAEVVALMKAGQCSA